MGGLRWKQLDQRTLMIYSHVFTTASGKLVPSMGPFPFPKDLFVNFHPSVEQTVIGSRCCSSLGYVVSFRHSLILWGPLAQGFIFHGNLTSQWQILGAMMVMPKWEPNSKQLISNCWFGGWQRRPKTMPTKNRMPLFIEGLLRF